MFARAHSIARYAVPRAATAIASLLAVLAVATPARALDLYVTSDASNQVRHYDGATGNYLNIFTPSFAANGQMAIHFGATNNRVLVGSTVGGVEEFDATTGGYIKTYAAANGWQWAGIYAPNGQVYIGSMLTNDIRRYDPVTGAFLGLLTPVYGPADMEIAPNGNLYIASYLGGFVLEVDATTGAPISNWATPFNSRPNDVAFLPGGHILVTCMGTNLVYRYNLAHSIVGVYAGTGWDRPHGIAIGPTDGNIYVVDGVTCQVHVFDPPTFTELNAAFLTPTPGDKIVDLAFKPQNQPTPASSATWGRIKSLYR